MPTKFRIARGKDEHIQNMPKTEGYVYFATDTGKIYYDANSNERVIMGGSGVAIHYGQASSKIEPNPDYSSGEFFLLSIEDDLVNDNEQVAVDDLIFNEDGVFYKIIEIDGDSMYCQKVAVAGGGGAVSTAKVINLKLETPDNINLINGQAASIAFIATSAIETDGSIMDDKLTISWSLAAKQGNSYVTYHNGTSFMVTHNERYVLSFGEYLRDSTTTKISIRAKGTNSGESKIKEQEFTTSELILTKAANFSNLKIYDKNNVILQCNVSGNMNKILDYYFDDVLIKSVFLKPGSETSQNCQVPADKCSHGYHTVRIELSQAIEKNAGSGDYFRALSVPPVKLEVAVREAGNEKPIIWLGDYSDKYYNYDDIRIPYLVYDPSSTGTTTIKLWKNNLPTASPERVVPSSQYTGFNIFEITDASQEMTNYYSISCGMGENEARRDITFVVEQDPNRKMEIVKEDFLKLLFNAKGRSNAESVTSRKKWTYKDVSAEFENFNWYNNGWVLDENGDTCLRISNGAKFKLPIGPIEFASTSAASQSWTFEMQFKVRNIQDYTELIQNITRYKSDDALYEEFTKQDHYTNYDAFLAQYLPQHPELDIEYDDLEFNTIDKKVNINKIACGYFSGGERPVGFGFGSQDAFFSNGTNTVSVSYVENEMIYLTMVYSHPEKRIYIYINGILTGAINSTVNNAYIVESEGIIFNSNYCDIDLYKFRIYNTPLNVYDVVMNYAVDTKDINTYDLCGTAVENTAIEEYQLKFGSDTEDGIIKYNSMYPHKYTMPYVIFDTSENTSTDELSYSKDNDVVIRMTFKNTGLDYAYTSGALEELAIADKLCSINDTPEVKAAAVKKYYLHHCPSFTGHNMNMAVQGTSSEFYPRRNYKIKAKTDYDPDEKKRVHFWLNAGPYEEDYRVHGEAIDTKAVVDKETGEEITPAYTNPCHTDWFYMNNYDVGTQKFTMKIDFMESSGSYNGGFCRLVKNAYSKHPLDDYMAKGALIDAGGQPIEVNTKSLRTNIDGFPVLAFHKRANGIYQYIGRYNMLLDKGSDDCYGFKCADDVLLKYAKNKKVGKVAECWEFSDNARTFCSYRDPLGRKDLSFIVPDAENEVGWKVNAKGSAPVVCDSFEYRYHTSGDTMDYIYDPVKKAKKKKDALAEFPTPGEGVENTLDVVNSLEDRGTIINNFYKNWERAVAWVWSTCLDPVPSQGVPVVADVGEAVWTRYTYYLTEDNVTYTIDGSLNYDPEKVYYKKDGDKYVGVAFGSIVYEPNTYYIKTKTGDYVISDGEFDSAETYYTITADEDVLAQHADRLVRQCTDEDSFDANEIYYTYDGTQIPTKAVVKVESLDEETFNADKAHYWAGIEKQYGKNVHRYDTKEYRNDKFKYELTEHFDIEYLATYFVMTEVFECYDSRGKNCMMASWGPQKEGGDYIWYPIFYDLDTQLGINNTGIPSFTYSVDATEEGNFSTSDSVLWNNFYNNFRDSYIIQKYRQLRGETGIDAEVGGKIAYPFLNNVDRIEKWYNADPVECGWLCKNGTTRAKNFAMMGQRPLIAINLDEYYKFITIYNPKGCENLSTDSTLYGTTGRVNNEGKFVVESTDYLYALQGDRSLSRRQFLSNRIQYTDSWLNVGNYARGGYNRIWGRIQSNNDHISDRWVETAGNPYWTDSSETVKSHEFDSEYWLTFTPIHNCYVTLGSDNENWPSQKFSGSPLRYKINSIERGWRESKNYKEQLLYVYGINQMADIGDLSKTYWTEFKIEGEANKLTRLKLGHDAYMTDENNNILTTNDQIWDGTNGVPQRWFNNNMNPPSLPSTGLPLVKEVNFSNITISTQGGGTAALDLTKSEKLENFRATGSNLTDVKFAPGVALNTLYLPSTVTRLDLTEARLLNTVLDTYTVPVKNAATGNIEAVPGLYVQGLTDLTDDINTITNVYYFNIVGDHFGYDSYKLLKKYYNNRKKQNSSTSYIRLTDVNWSPYVKLVEGDTFDSTQEYYRDNGHYGLVKCAESEIANIFTNAVKNGELYVLDKTCPTENINLIADADMLFDFINRPTFAGTSEGRSIPELEGIMYVANDVAVDEYEIRTKLNVAYPKLNIFFKNVTEVYSAKFIVPNMTDDEPPVYLGTYSYASDGRTEELSIQKIKTGWFTNPYDTYVPEKFNYDFLGWSTSLNESDIFTKEQWSSFTLDENIKDYVFYALFSKTKYKMTYYAGEKIIGTEDITYGEILKTPALYPSYTDNNLAFNEVYRFLGFTTNARQLVVDRESDARLVDFGRMTAVQNYDFYACFIKEEVHENLSNMDYFIVDENTRSISPKPGVEISGKITLPTSYGGIPIERIGGFNNANIIKITHVFWKQTDGLEHLTQISANAFRGIKTLEYFEMPSTITKIGQAAFSNCPFREIVIPEGCESIDTQAFNACGGDSYTEPFNIFIPGSVSSIGDRAFAYMQSRPEKVTIGSLDHQTKLTRDKLNKNAFRQNSNPGQVVLFEIYTNDNDLKQYMLDEYPTSNYQWS